METALLCLANSKKTGGRCLAGIEVTIDGDRIHYHMIGKKPKWLRPISFGNHGEINNIFSEHVKLLDVITINMIEPCPQRAQTENVFFKQEKVQVNCCIEPISENLDVLCSNETPIFRNTLNYVPNRELNVLNHSLIFIKVDNFSYYETKSITGAQQFRATFTHQSINYDFPITDLQFINTGIENVAREQEIQAYLTLSLGEIFRGNCYKLIAGVIIL
jgi:hypothetical protein